MEELTHLAWGLLGGVTGHRRGSLEQGFEGCVGVCQMNVAAGGNPGKWHCLEKTEISEVTWHIVLVCRAIKSYFVGQWW